MSENVDRISYPLGGLLNYYYREAAWNRDDSITEHYGQSVEHGTIRLDGRRIS